MGDRDHTGPEQDRRRATRHLACFPAYVGTEKADQPNIALIRDVSTRGALLLTRERFEVGDALELSMYVSGESSATAHEVRGSVVRIEDRQPEQADVWPFSAAVEFDEPVDELEKELEALEEHQRKLGLHRD